MPTALALQQIAFSVLGRVTRAPGARGVVSACETRILARMLRRTMTADVNRPALGYLFARHEHGRSARDIYADVFSSNRFERGYRSQVGQDLFLNRWFFKDRGPGVFVDVGAFDGELGSNTYFFEKQLGWRGIAFEPQPDAFAALSRTRSCRTLQACAYDSDGEVSFLALSEKDQRQRVHRATQPTSLLSMLLDPVHGAVMLSGINAHIDNRSRVERMREVCDLDQSLVNVPCYRIDTVLAQEKVKTVDYLSIDVEGAEVQVLQGIDFNQIQVNVISVERSPRFGRIAELLTAANFEHHGLLFFDEIFVHRRPRFSWEQ